MARFKLFRSREANGMVDHVLEFFLVETDGHARLQYIGTKPRQNASRAILNGRQQANRSLRAKE